MADDQTVWVVCDEECSQGALGFTGERAWRAGVPKPLGPALAAHLVGDGTGTFHVAAAPDASTPPDGTTEPAPPVSDEAVTPPAELAPEPADSGAQPVEPAAVAAEGTAT